VTEHAGDHRAEAEARTERGNARHTLAVARLRQGRPEAVGPLCADALAASLPPATRATVLATAALGRHGIGLPGGSQLAEALALDPAAALVGEAAAALASQPDELPATA